MSHCAVYKSLAAEFLDDFLGGETMSLADAYDRAVQLLTAHANDSLSATAADLVSDGQLSPDIGTANDFEQFWLADDSQLAGKEVDRVMRAGYAEALRIGREEYPELVPIETFWLTGASDDFEVQVCKGKRKVTVFLFIPTARRYGSTRAETQSFAVRVGGLRDDDSRTVDDGKRPQIVSVQLSGTRASTA
jgi:hypothetical protein